MDVHDIFLHKWDCKNAPSSIKLQVTNRRFPNLSCMSMGFKGHSYPARCPLLFVHLSWLVTIVTYCQKCPMWSQLWHMVNPTCNLKLFAYFPNTMSVLSVKKLNHRQHDHERKVIKATYGPYGRTNVPTAFSSQIWAFRQLGQLLLGRKSVSYSKKL